MLIVSSGVSPKAHQGHQVTLGSYSSSSWEGRLLGVAPYSPSRLPSSSSGGSQEGSPSSSSGSGSGGVGVGADASILPLPGEVAVEGAAVRAPVVQGAGVEGGDGSSSSSSDVGRGSLCGVGAHTPSTSPVAASSANGGGDSSSSLLASSVTRGHPGVTPPVTGPAAIAEAAPAIMAQLPQWEASAAAAVAADLMSARPWGYGMLLQAPAVNGQHLVNHGQPCGQHLDDIHEEDVLFGRGEEEERQVGRDKDRRRSKEQRGSV